MNENILNLQKKFQIIKQKGWVKSISNSTGSVGTTFEKLLNIKENCSSFADYNGIELKCTTNTYSPITLFSMNFDGPSSYELQRIANKFGHPDNIFKNRTIIYSSLSCNNDYLVSEKYYFKIQIDKYNNKIYLVITDKNHKLIEKQCYITFENIKKHLDIKLKYLAIIYAFKKHINEKKYFKYYNLLLYKFKDFDTFLKLIEKNIIKIQMILRINKSKLHYGKSSYKNIVFYINKYNLENLFTKLN